MSVIYPKAGTSFLGQSPSIDLDTDTIRISIGRVSAYTYSASDQFKSAVTTVQDASAALSSVTLTTPQEATFDSADPVFTAVSAGAALNFLVIWKDTGNTATSPVIAYIDGFSVTPNGGDITDQWDNGTNRVFKLV